MANVTAAGFPVQLKGVEYTMTPLTDKDIEELDNWMRATHIDMVRSSLGPELKEDERRELLSIAMMQAREISWYSELGSKVMATIPGIVRVIWQSLRKSHPDLKIEFVRECLVDPNTRVDTLMRWRELNVGDAPGESRKGQPKKTRRRPLSRKSMRS